MSKKIKDAINTLKTESCYECTYGCESPFSCESEFCKLKEAVMLAVKHLEMQIEKMPYTDEEKADFFEEGKEPRGYWGMGEFYYFYICPHCEREIEFEPAGLEKIRKRERERCKYCGGALNWGLEFNDGN